MDESTPSYPDTQTQGVAMSSRALRKLKGGRAQEELVGPAAVDEDEEEAGGPHVKGGASAPSVNRFCLLGDEEQEEGDAEGDDEAGGSGLNNNTETQGATGEGSPAHGGGAKKARRRKKRALKETKEEDGLLGWEEVGEGGRADSGERLTEPPTPHPHNSAPHDHRHVLNVEHRHLNPENELKRYFGARAVMGDRSRRRQHNRPCRRHTWLTVPKDTWPRPGRTGITMDLEESRGALHFFRFVHSRDYQRVQHSFLDAVDSIDPQNLVALTHASPYHVDSLLQLSDVCRLQDDHEMAREFVERALFCLESSFHPLFSLTSGSCRLDYRYPENRSLYLALFKHLTALENRGCSRTALELAKLLLSLSPEDDPLGVLLIMDHLCLRSREYLYLTHLYHDLEPSRNLSQLPNMAFSVALACFYLEEEEREARGGGHDRGHDPAAHSKANELLHQALLAFPSVLMPLLGKCGVEPTPEVTKHPYLGLQASRGDPRALQELVWLFVARGAAEWRAPPVVLWLERGVARLQEALRGDARIGGRAAAKRQTRYRSAPRNVHRHVLLSEAKEAAAYLPAEVTNSPILGHDPLPPLDSIVSYTRPERPPAPAAGGTLSLFFRSLLPSFNMQQEPAAPGGGGEEAGEEAGEEVGEEGAEGGGGGGEGGREVGRRITQLLAAMRELLANVRFEEGGGAQPRRHDDDEEPGDEEWD